MKNSVRFFPGDCVFEVIEEKGGLNFDKFNPQLETLKINEAYFEKQDGKIKLIIIRIENERILERGEDE